MAQSAVPIAKVVLAAVGAQQARQANVESKKAAGRQQEEIQRQKNIEGAALAEEEDVIGRQRLAARTGGRRSLIRTSEIGIAPRRTLG